jgi:NADH dehydrogenase
MVRETNTSKKPRVVILGAGFAGIYAAINLSKELGEKDADVLLVDCNNYHLFKPMLHEVATGGVETNSIIQPIRKIMEGRRFNFLEGMAQVIDPEKKIVKVCEDCAECTKLDECDIEDFGLMLKDVASNRREEVPYDYLVIALGGSANYFKIPGAKEFSFPLQELDDATALRKRITSAFKIANMVADKEARKRMLAFVVVGAGPAGIEFVSSLHDWVYTTVVCDFPRLSEEEITIYLVEAGGAILPFSDKKTQEKARKQLQQKAIKILTGSPVTEVAKSYVEIKGGKKIETFTTIWTAGVRGHEVVTKADFKKDGLDRMIVNEFLEVPDYPGVYSLGDCASCTPLGTDAPLPQTGQVAVQEAKCMVKNIAADIRGDKKCAFRYRELGSSFSIGEYTGLANVLGILRVGGFFGWFIWKLTYLKHLWGIKRGPAGALEWFFDITYDREASRHKFSK